MPFVYAFWAGRPEALTPDDVLALQQARDAGVERIDDICPESTFRRTGAPGGRRPISSG